MNKVNLKLNRNDYYYLYLFFFLNVLFRLPSLSNSIGRYIFVDEKLYVDEVLSLIQNNTLILNFFKSGQLNIFPVAVFVKLVDIFTNFVFETSTIIIFARGFFNILLNSYVLKFIIQIRKLLNFYYFKRELSKSTLILIFFFNPYLFANSRIWYADSYMYLVCVATIYYHLKIYFEGYNKIDFNKLIITLSIGISIKYNYVFFLFSACVLYILKHYKNMKFNFFDLIIHMGIFIFLIAALNYSIFFNYELFLTDLKFNSDNYGGTIFLNDNFSFFSLDFIKRILYHGIFLFIVPINILGSIFYLYSLVTYIISKKYFLLYLFYIFPLIYVFIISSFPKVFLNRNINFLIPIILISTYVGIEHLTNNKAFSFLKYFLLSLFFVQFSFVLYDDLKDDSRLVAEKWINQNFMNNNLTVGYNSGYTESTTWVLENAINDRYLDNQLDYYVIDDYWENGFFDIGIRKNILLVINHKSTHFYYDSNYNILSRNLSKDKTFKNFENYNLLKYFSGNGPDIYIFEKKITIDK